MNTFHPCSIRQKRLKVENNIDLPQLNNNNIVLHRWTTIYSEISKYILICGHFIFIRVSKVEFLSPHVGMCMYVGGGGCHFLIFDLFIYF